MRIERLAMNRIKVTVSDADFLKMNIDPKKLRPDSRELHAFMFYVMQTIHKETDFDPFSGQITMEAVQRDGGMSVIVSKIVIGKKRYTKEELRRVTSVKATVKKRCKSVVYFENFENVCNALKLVRDEFLLKSSLYKLEGKYCMMFPSETYYEPEKSVMIEFSQGLLIYDLQEEFVKEHGKCIAEGNYLISMADGIKKL